VDRVLKVFYAIIPIALGGLFGTGITDLADSPRSTLRGVCSLILGLGCFLGWLWHKNQEEKKIK